MILKVIIRNFLKRPFLHLVKVVGLSLALAGIVFISLFLKNELSYDSYHEKAPQIYRYTFTDPGFLGGKHFARLVNPAHVKELAEAVPEIEKFVRLCPVRGGLVKFKEQFYNVVQGFVVDSTFFQVFNSGIIVGNKQSVLEMPNSMVVSESFAKKVFGNANPVGEVLALPAGQFYGEEQQFTVNGVMNDFPVNSHFHPDFIIAASQNSFQNSWAWTYLVLNKNANTTSVKSGIKKYLRDLLAGNSEEFDTEVHLQKFSDIHLHSDKLREIEPNGNMRNLYVLAIAAFILLLISISNYANLNIGMSGFSAKYLYITKLLGSSKLSVVRYFFTEGLLIVLATLLLTLFIATPVNSFIIQFYGVSLLHGNALFIIVLVLLFSALSLLLGMLPVLKSVFSSLIFKNNTNTLVAIGKRGISRGLIVFQYAFSIALIIAVIVISRQTNYAMNNGLGVQHDNIVVFESLHASLQQKFELFKHELLQYNSIQSVSAMMEPPGGEANDMFPFEMEGYQADETVPNSDHIGVFPCDYSFASLFNLQFLSGTNFSEINNDNDGAGEYIINEAAMKRLNYTNAADIVGKEFQLTFSVPAANISIPKGKIIGVVKDFYLSSLKKEVEPLVMFKRDKMWLINFVVAFNRGMQKEALDDMKKVWMALFPEYPFQCEAVGAMYEKVYKAELLQAKLLSIFTFIALFICSMGLLGLALIITQQKTKEIGVRKVNGARVVEILILLNRDFVKWVAIAFVFACPVAWYAMTKWLENFAYKTSLSWWIFAVAGVFALGIALLTVSFQSWKAASQNPVDALRYE